ncbi:MAG: YbaK/EbsC family protein [Gammaproteobacteria bacterium]|nr:YbaK/EbsC family protein [Gammaproteobacteria bacterium]
MSTAKLRNLLDQEHIRYITIQHSPAYTAQEIAASAHIPGKELAKTVIAKINKKLSMLVLPASYKVHLKLLSETLGTKNVELVPESEFENAFPECELGAMPPFGNLYDMNTYVDKSLEEDEEIAFNAGNHSELIKLAYKDYVRIAKPEVISFT